MYIALKEISWLIIFMFTYFTNKSCSIQVNNAGIGGIVIKDNDLYKLAIYDLGVSI